MKLKTPDVYWDNFMLWMILFILSIFINAGFCIGFSAVQMGINFFLFVYSLRNL